MLRKFLNYTVIQKIKHILPNIGNNVNNQMSKMNYNYIKTLSTTPVLNKLYSSSDPEKQRELKRLQVKVLTIKNYMSDKMVKMFFYLGCFRIRTRIRRA